MGYQNFFATRLFTDIGAADTTITLENPPTPTSGRLVLEARNTSKREIISYTGVSGNDITGVTRGVGGTSATDHAKNSLVEMNVVAEDLSDALAVPSDIITRFNETISDHVASGLVVTDDTGLTADISAGVAYINGIRLNISAVNNRTFTASKDTYVDLGDNGVLDYNEVSNNAAPPALSANHLRLARVVTNATDTTSVFNYPNGSHLSTDDGWRGGLLPDITSITSTGGNAVDIVFASSVASLLSRNMKLKVYRKLPAPTYMGGAFNGSSHYFIKTSPTSTLSTITNNFTIMGWVEPTAVSVQQCIAARADAGTNNGIFFMIQPGGRPSVQVSNAGAGNYRLVTANAAISTTRRTFVAVTWTSGTVTMYIDGVLVGTTTSTTGSAPTTAGTGGDFAIGRYGAFSGGYFTGYISGVAVFDAVLTQATIRSYRNQVLTGSETNCIGAWSLNNTAVNQQNPGTNDLTATGGVGYTLRSPYANDTVNVPNGIIEYATITDVSGATVSAISPEGNAIPTTGGIQQVAFSYNDVPFNFPKSRTALFRSISNPAIINPTNTSQDYADKGMAVVISTPTPITVLVTGAQGVGSTSDYEFNTQIRVDGTVIKSHTPSASLGNVGGRSMTQSITVPIPLTAGNHVISLGGNFSYDTGL